MSSYFNNSIPLFPNIVAIQDQISQLQETSAVAPFIQTANHVVTFATSDPPGPGSDHNLLVNTPVVVDPNLGNISAVNSIVFNSVTPIPVAGSLWLNSGNNHLMHGAVDLESASSANVTSTSAPVTGDALVRYDGVSGTFVETSQVISGSLNTQFYGASGPQISVDGISFLNPAAAIVSSIFGHYSNNFINTAYTGPYLVNPGTVLLLLERIGNIVFCTIASALTDIADAAAPAAIVMSTPVPVGYRPLLATKQGTLGIINDDVYDMGSWYMSTAGILTIRPSLNPTSTFSAPVAGTSGALSFVTLTYTVQN